MIGIILFILRITKVRTSVNKNEAIKTGEGCFSEIEQAYLKHFKEFEKASTQIFFKLSKGTSCFSPFYTAYNLHLQVAQGEYGPEYSDISNDQLYNIDFRIRYNIAPSVDKKSNSEIFTSCILLPNTANYTLTNKVDFNVFLYDKSTIQTCLKNYKKWIHSKIVEKNTLTLKKYNLSLRNQRFYNSMIIMNVGLTLDYTITKDFFIIANGFLKEIEFISLTEDFHYDNVELGDVDYDVVCVPIHPSRYLSDLNSIYLIYVIPDRYDIKAEDLWDLFTQNSLGQIRDIVSDSSTKRNINLLLPKRYVIETEIDNQDIFLAMFKRPRTNNVVTRSFAKITILSEKNEVVKDQSKAWHKGTSDLFSIKANIPHISLIYAPRWKRILFVMKDETGGD